jgi:hypothetical protein
MDERAVPHGLDGPFRREGWKSTTVRRASDFTSAMVMTVPPAGDVTGGSLSVVEVASRSGWSTARTRRSNPPIAALGGGGSLPPARNGDFRAGSSV